MTIKELKKLIKNLPDDMEIVSGGIDHSFVEINIANKVKAAYNGCEYSEFYGKEHLSEDEEVVTVFYINQ